MEKSYIDKFVDTKKIFKLMQNKNKTPQIEKFLFNVMSIKIFLEKLAKI